MLFDNGQQQNEEKCLKSCQFESHLILKIIFIEICEQGLCQTSSSFAVCRIPKRGLCTSSEMDQIQLMSLQKWRLSLSIKHYNTNDYKYSS